MPGTSPPPGWAPPSLGYRMAPGQEQRPDLVELRAALLVAAVPYALRHGLDPKLVARDWLYWVSREAREAPPRNPEDEGDGA
jgi:hypothetical protein